MPSTIRIYRLVDPSTMYLNAGYIAQYFFGMPQLITKDKTFSIDSSTGFFSYSYRSMFFGKFAKDKLPKTPQEAKKAAEAFIQRADALVQRERVFTQQQFPPLFRNLRYVNAKSVANSLPFGEGKGGAIIDHWTVLFQGYVKPSKDEDAVPVLDSKVEFKIGNGGMVIGVEYQWATLQMWEDDNKLVSVKSNKPNAELSIVYLFDFDERSLNPFYVSEE